MSACRVCCGLLVALTLPLGQRADAADPAVFALIIGVNRSVDRDLPPLRYADDDAARYFELFRMVGAKGYLLSRFDDNTRRVHVQAAAEAQLPTAVVLRRTLARLKRDVARARARRLSTRFYLVYAGHGKAAAKEPGSAGYISLEDERLTGKAIATRIVAAVGADANHVMIDACNSYLLALGRGPGGQRRPARGFSRLAGTLSAPGVGLLLSTSSARDSHEWEGVQAGVFSHAVRSGLFGAADADGDRQISYREIAAFVENAYRAIPNERFRGKVFARPPARSNVLLDLRSQSLPSLRVGGERHGRFLLEDTRGVRLADFHSGASQPVRLVRPGGRRVYLRRIGTDLEYAIPPGEGLVTLASLSPARPRAAVRGAASHAFARLFEQPFDRQVVDRFSFRRLPALVRAGAVARRQDRPHRPWRRILAWTAAGLSATALATGAIVTASASRLADGAPEAESQRERVDRNASIARRNTAATALYVVGGAVALSSLVLLLWPDAPAPPLSAAILPGGAGLTLRSSFD